MRWQATRGHYTAGPRELNLLDYNLETIHLNKAQLQSLDFVVNRIFMKLFKTNSMQTVELCGVQFSFDLSSVMLVRRCVRFMNKADWISQGTAV